MNVLVVIYADLELYPPSLNAVLELASRVDRVHVVQRSLGYGCVEFPANVTVSSAVNVAGGSALHAMTARDKLRGFRRFVRALRAVRAEVSPQLIIAYDPLPLLAVRLSMAGNRSSTLWYHNHDKEVRNLNRFLSLGWWAYATESSAFRRIDFFSLPARERLPLFATHKLKNSPVVLPNYPAMDRVGHGRARPAEGELRLVYQGSLGRHHGFKEIIPWLGRNVGGKQLNLTLVGKIDPGFQTELGGLAEQYGVSERLRFMDFVPFMELPSVLTKFDIGLAIHKPVGVTYTTGATASNKIYEYAAAGLPVVLFDSAHYREHLAGQEWTAFCDLTWPSFAAALESLSDDYERRSEAATRDIKAMFNFGAVFQRAWEGLTPLLDAQEPRCA